MNLKKTIKSGTSKHAAIAVRVFAVWLIISAGGSLITAYLINTKIISLEMSGYGAVVTLLVSSFIASTLAISMIGEKRLLVAGVCALGITALLTLCNIIFIGEGVHGFFATVLVVLAGCFAAAFMNAKPKKKHRYI